ncbi:MAG: hypothetical protein AAGI23_02525 [Bacteroidota bacterium]
MSAALMGTPFNPPTFGTGAFPSYLTHLNSARKQLIFNTIPPFLKETAQHLNDTA